jgi:FAD/FMN-containing dehydrogenase
MTVSHATSRATSWRPTIPDFAGDVLVPGDPGFDDARRVENDAIDRRPALIARCADARDVASALRHARATGLGVTVRAGGHGRDGFAVADEALVLDLRPMRGIAVDPIRRRVRVAGGATWRELDAAAGAHGLVTGARLPSVGVAGFTLGSGSGWLERKFGLAADSLHSARVVTADGDEVTASAHEHPELFWALRGGGPSFGVVVELEFELYPVEIVTAGMMAWPAHRTIEVAAAYDALMRHAPDDLGGGLALFNAPPARFVSDALHSGPGVAVVVLWTGAADDADAPLAPLRALAPATDVVRRTPYATLQGIFESPDRYTARMHGEGAFLTGIPTELMCVLAEHQARKPVPLGSLLLQPMGGAFARVRQGDTPLGQRDAPWALQVGAAWFDAAQDDAALQWASGLREAIAPWSRGVPYPNFMPTVDPERLRASYGAAVWERLQAIRAEWDPDDVFAAGHAITLPD